MSIFCFDHTWLLRVHWTGLHSRVHLKGFLDQYYLCLFESSKCTDFKNPSNLQQILQIDFKNNPGTPTPLNRAVHLNYFHDRALILWKWPFQKLFEWSLKALLIPPFCSLIHPLCVSLHSKVVYWLCAGCILITVCLLVILSHCPSPLLPHPALRGCPRLTVSFYAVLQVSWSPWLWWLVKTDLVKYFGPHKPEHCIMLQAAPNKMAFLDLLLLMLVDGVEEECKNVPTYLHHNTKYSFLLVSTPLGCHWNYSEIFLTSPFKLHFICFFAHNNLLFIVGLLIDFLHHTWAFEYFMIFIELCWL